MKGGEGRGRIHMGWCVLVWIGDVEGLWLGNCEVSNAGLWIVDSG